VKDKGSRYPGKPTPPVDAQKVDVTQPQTEIVGTGVEDALNELRVTEPSE
jgi:hypothetical protein